MESFSMLTFVSILLPVLLEGLQITNSTVLKVERQRDFTPRHHNVTNVVPWTGDIRIVKRACYEWLDIFNKIPCYVTKGHPYITRCKRFPHHGYFTRCGLPEEKIPDLCSSIPALNNPYDRIRKKPPKVKTQ